MSFEEPRINPFPKNDSEREEYFSAGELLRKKYPDNFKALDKQIGDAPFYDLVKRSEPKNPNAWVDLWYDRMSDFHKRHMDPESMALIRNGFHEKYVIKPENVPESYFKNQQRLARERGYGDIEVTEEAKAQATEVIVSDQKSTLDNWINYIFSSDADVYPMWARYLAIQSITKLSTYDKEKECFAKRRNDTVAPFPDLNREALAVVIDLIVKKARKENIVMAEGNPELKKLIDSENFGKLYAYAIEKVTPTEKNELMETDGEWITYPQGSDHMPLVESLQGHGTGWCTAGEETAKTQLEAGDFYVYYSKDNDGRNTIPRVAIRMEGDNIGEVRGIGPDQNLDPYIGEIADKKLKEFPDGAQYNKRVEDMELLTAIDKKQNAAQDLTVEELRFLYEIDSKIEGFGYNKDPRIQAIIEKRNPKADISLVTGFAPEEIGLSAHEVTKGGIKCYCGNLDLSDCDEINFQLPEIVTGKFEYEVANDIRNVVFPKQVGGGFDLLDAEGLKNVVLPELVRGDVVLCSLKSFDNLILPKKIGGGLFLGNVRNADGIKLPDILEGSLNLNCLESAKGVIFPKSVGDLYLDNVKSADGLLLPEIINGDLDLKSIRTAIDLSDPKSPQLIKFPNSVGGTLNLSFLENADGAILPEIVKGHLCLNELKSAKNVKFPNEVVGDVFLFSLELTDGLILPASVGGKVYFSDTLSSKKEQLAEQYPDIKIEFSSKRDYESKRGYEYEIEVVEDEEWL